MWKSISACLLIMGIPAQWSCAAVIIDDFTSGEFELTHEYMRQTHTNGLTDVADALPNVATGHRGIAVGTFAESIFTNPEAHVRLAVEDGKLELESNYGAETFTAVYGDIDNPLDLDITHSSQQSLVVDFAYYRTSNPSSTMPSLLVRVGGRDLNGDFRPGAPSPFFYTAHSASVPIPGASEEPFSVVVPLDQMTSNLNPVDLTSIYQLGLRTMVSPVQREIFSFAIDEIRIVPEPSSGIMSIIAGCLAVMCLRRSKR